MATSLDHLADADYLVEAIVEDVEAKRDAVRGRSTASRKRTRSSPRTPRRFRSRRWRRDGARRPGARHALHESRAADAARRVDSRSSDLAGLDDWPPTSLCDRLGKTAVEAADFPGFISNRILMPMINEAIYAVMEGVGTPEAIDTVMKLGMNHPMGPLTLADFIGLDVCLAIMNVLHDGFGDSKYRPCPLLRRMVAAGRLGRKSGQGFYSYQPQRQPVAAAASRSPTPSRGDWSAGVATEKKPAAFGLREQIDAGNEPRAAERPEHLQAERRGRCRCRASRATDATRTRRRTSAPRESAVRPAAA